MTHYQRLGIEPTATPAEVRDAYRRAARAHHPDTRGDASADRMSEVNEAWRVLRDPELRRRYDQVALHAPASPGDRSSMSRDAQQYAEQASRQPPTRYEPVRFPWRFMAGMAAVGIVVVLVGTATYEPSGPAPPDRLIGAGSCVELQPNGDASEVSCSQPHDGVVDVIVAFDAPCPVGTEPHRDQQGLGIACVRVP